MTKLVKKAAVACLVLAMVLGATAPAFAQGFVRARVEAFSTVSWTASTDYRSFRVVVDGDGDTDLDVWVYDAVTGRFLGSDTDATDYCIVRGYSDSGRLVIWIRNLGGVYNVYTLSVR